MKEEIKHATEAIVNHPKTAVAVTGLANLNVWWMDYGEPLVKALTSILGLVVIILLVIKHFLDIKEQLSNKENKED